MLKHTYAYPCTHAYTYAYACSGELSLRKLLAGGSTEAAFAARGHALQRMVAAITALVSVALEPDLNPDPDPDPGPSQRPPRAAFSARAAGAKDQGCRD